MDFVVFLVVFLDACEDFHCIFYGRFIYSNGLETSFESGIFFDVLSVLTESRSTDDLNFAS